MNKRHLLPLVFAASISIGLGGCRWGFEFDDGDSVSIGDGDGDPVGGSSGDGDGDTVGSGGASGDGDGDGDTSSSGGTSMGSGGAETGGVSGAGGSASGGAAGVGSIPVAVLSANKTFGSTATTFTFDASASSDAEDSIGALTFEWDFTGGGAFVSLGAIESHSFVAAGSYDTTVRVTDTDGNSATATISVEVATTSDYLIVDISQDEDDPGATKDMPLGAGLSLREALNIANAEPGRQVIDLTGIIATPEYVLPYIYEGTDIIGNGTGGVNAAAISNERNCLHAFVGDVRFLGLELFNCSQNGIQVQNGNGCTVSGCKFHDIAQHAVFTSASSGHIISGNEITSCGVGGVAIYSGTTQVDFNHFYGNAGTGIGMNGGSAGGRVLGNLVEGGTTSVSIADTGIQVAHNTLVSATTGIANSGSEAQVLNNIVAQMSGYAVTGTAGSFSALDFGISFDNALGLCSSCGAGVNFVTVDPLFVNPPSDYAVQSTSPARNAGTDLGLDVNGSRSGTFDGSAPDLGFAEFVE